ncbi:MAG TPA: glycoside hydrolase family 4 [Kiritimatiellia bacterium]|nr:glycoside hydrolase family 4 [Kiritimatiellia bacterium]
MKTRAATQHPKVVLIGAGSLFFGRKAIWQMTHSEVLRGGTLALVDTDPVHLQRMKLLAERVIAHTRAPLKLECATDAREVLAGADFVILSFADRTVKFRGLDCQIAAKYGIRMCSGDTIGPGGIMRTLREFPVILAYTRAIRELCPEAWVINYINPSAAHGIGLQRHAPDLRSLALCDIHHMPYIKRRFARRAGIVAREEELTPELEAKFDLRIAGPNHFTWMLKAEFDGKDVQPAIAESMRLDGAKETVGGDTGAKARFNEAICHALYEAFGHIPTAVGHTKEYVRFWQGLGKSPETIPPLSIWETGARYERHAEMWREVDRYGLGVSPIEEFIAKTGSDHATDVVEAMWAKAGKPFFINTPNNGTVPNMPDDAFLEMLCDVDMDGVRPRPVGPAPVGLRSLWQQVLDTHELSVEAAVTCDRGVLLRAFLCDPLVSSLADSRAMIDELLAAEADALPAAWNKAG